MTALTRRERKVKDILLKELAGLEEIGGLSYVQKQRLEKRIDHDYIDEQLAEMRTSLARQRKFQWVALPAAVLCIAFVLYELASGAALEGYQINLVTVAFAAWGLRASMKAMRRKIFIYEALRELSDADEEGVRLDRAVREADELIERVVRRELGEDALPAEDTPPADEYRQRMTAAPFAPKQRAAPAAESKGVSLTEMQRRKERGSTILNR